MIRAAHLTKLSALTGVAQTHLFAHCQQLFDLMCRHRIAYAQLRQHEADSGILFQRFQPHKGLHWRISHRQRAVPL